MKTSSKKLALTGIILALALIIGTIENYLPPIIPFLPFVKIGFSNVAILFSCVTLGFLPTITITIFKSVLVPIFVVNPIMIAYSLTASLFSVSISYLLLYTKKVGIPTVGIIGAILNNLIQLCVASLIMSDPYVFGFIPYLTATGFLAGLITGIISYLLIRYMPKEIMLMEN